METIKMKNNQHRLFWIVILPLSLFMFSCRSTAYFTGKDHKKTNKVAEWQMANYSDTIAPETGWVYAALFRGMMAWAEETNNKKIEQFLLSIAERNKWGLLPRTYDADDLCVGQTYFRFYEHYKKPEMIKDVKARVDSVIMFPDTSPLITDKGKYYRGRWGWCDALFMAPPVYSSLSQNTSDSKYLDFCFAEYKVTTDSLYDKERKLFYRDLSLKYNRDEKGSKIFWGRGNGWVYAGLALMLTTVPKSHPSYQYYMDLYLQMTEGIISCQDKNGAWHSNMLDSETYPQPENSASGFFVFGLAWGINQGILTSASQKQAAATGWKSLQKYVDRNGKLGYIQPIGHAPRDVTADMTSPYGVGAYLLAATEMKKMKN